ncbi:MAG: S-layer homology domain-containing protein [Bacillota bacterium]
MKLSRILPICAAFLIVMLLAHPVFAFPDVNSHWAELEIRALNARGVIRGFQDGTFLPDVPVTRAQFAKMLVLALGYADEAEQLARVPSRFVDLGQHWALGYMEIGYDLGLFMGYGDGRMRPDNPISRAELVAVVIRAMKLENQVKSNPQSQFADFLDVPAWARGYVALAQERGVVSGFPDGTFRPFEHTTRAEAAVIIMRFLRSRGLWADAYGVITGIQGSRVTIRNGGTSETITLSPRTTVFRNGKQASMFGLKLFDELFVVFGSGGTVEFIEAVFLDEMGRVRQVDWQNRALVFLPVGSVTDKTITLSDSTQVFKNGRSARITDIQVGDRLYVVYSSFDRSVRYVDATRFEYTGTITQVSSIEGTLLIQMVDGQSRKWPVLSDALLFLNGKPVPLASLAPGDVVSFATVQNNQITYLEAER